MKVQSILVLGASGTVGSEIVKILKAQGHEVKGTTSKKNVSEDKVFVDLSTGEGLQEAFHGIDRAFLLSPPGHADQYKILSPAIIEAKKRNLKKVVLMTAMGANADDNSPFRKAEKELEESGLDYNIIRPNWFMQNFSTFWVQGIKEQKKIFLPAGDSVTSFIDARDVSEVAAKLLTDDSFSNMDFDLTGPIPLDHHFVAKVISTFTERDISYLSINPDEFRKELLSAGLNEDYTNFMVLIMGFLKEGYNAKVTDNVKLILGRAPGNFENYVRDYKESFIS